MNMRRDVFQAIADPVRRDIIELLSKEDMTVNEVAENFEISRPAISKHLKILKECEVINIKKEGRERRCTIVPKQLMTVADWLESYGKLWDNKLDIFENYLEVLKRKNQ